MIALMFFLPLFAQQGDNKIITLPLLSYIDARDYAYIWVTYVAGFVLIVLFGVAQLALQNWQHRTWLRGKVIISLALSVFLIMFTMANRQPYPGMFLLCLLVLKGLLLIKQP